LPLGDVRKIVDSQTLREREREGGGGGKRKKRKREGERIFSLSFCSFFFFILSTRIRRAIIVMLSHKAVKYEERTKNQQKRMWIRARAILIITYYGGDESRARSHEVRHFQR